MTRIFILAWLFLSGCNSGRIMEDDSLGAYFREHGSEGCFGLFENGTGQFTLYNLERYRDSAYLPASTFKIVSSLVGLQTGVISDAGMVIPWDGVERPMTQWNRDLTMNEAFRLSSVPYYQEVARRIGRNTMQIWLDSLVYGNRLLFSAVDTFWLDNTLKITPDEQLGLVKKLYFGQLPFHRVHQETVKQAMLMEDRPEYRLGYKTGLGILPDGGRLAWIVGYIVENEHPSFFVLNMESRDPATDLVMARMEILKKILKKLGYFEGRK